MVYFHVRNNIQGKIKYFRGVFMDASGTQKTRALILEYLILTVATFALAFGIYVFRFQNNFTFGGVTGISLILSAVTGLHASTLVMILNAALLVVAFIVLGRGFTAKSIYVTALYSVLIYAFDYILPIDGPLTDEPVLELLFAIMVPATASAAIFHFDASSGGTDIIAMILKKYTNVNIGTGLLFADALTVVCSFFVFGVKTGLFSLTGFLAKSIVIDNVIESINICKFFHVVCTDPEPICDYICNVLHRDATVYEAKGAFTGGEKRIIMTVMTRRQAVALRSFIRKQEPTAFIMITNTSEIIGKGFRATV